MLAIGLSGYKIIVNYPISCGILYNGLVNTNIMWMGTVCSSRITGR
jgi:hypothetical protein